MNYHTIGDSDIQRLRKAGEKHGASEAELAAIERLSKFEAKDVDIERLWPLARIAGVEFEHLSAHIRRVVFTESETILLFSNVERELIRWFRQGGFSLDLEIRISCPEHPRMCAGTVLTSPPDSLVRFLRSRVRETVEENVPKL